MIFVILVILPLLKHDTKIIIILEINGIKMPKVRSWFYNEKDKFLGTRKISARLDYCHIIFSRDSTDHQIILILFSLIVQSLVPDLW